ncbi:helix-turn-helix domain-containing protein [Flavobacterium sp.]|uniref:helix-turn-helix domain-containing protein n=1 Tax=Flavobacterium sp. TaxID=239 RepID=UPI001226E8CF|nr:helix-turn-helix domain-containing protein [Flavobacterium sp.]RZJ73062.1 MAG: helix-turn-helix domain-containing protein [Flavobacterium sp.]
MRPPLVFFVFFHLFLSGQIAAQKNSDPDALIAKANEFVSSDPEKAIKIGEHLSKTISLDRQRCDVALFLAKSWCNKGQFGNSLTSAFEAKKLAEANGLKEQLSDAEITIASNLRTLQLDDQSVRYLEMAGDDLDASEKSAANKRLLLAYNNQKALIAKERGDFESALVSLSKSREIGAKFPAQNRNELSDAFFIGAQIHLARKQYDSAISSFSKSLTTLPKNGNGSVQYLLVANQLASVYFQQKQHRQAIDLLLKAATVADKIGNVRLQESVNRQLAFNYLALGNQAKYRFYNKLYQRFDDLADTSESEATNVAFNLISVDLEAANASRKAEYARYFYMALSAVVVALAYFAFVFFRNKARISRFCEIHDYLSLDKKPIDEVADANKKEQPKQLSIPAETEQNLLAKLRKFESSSRFTSKEMSLAVLAGQFDTNTKYLSEIINKHRGDNFNTYINKLRIAYIADKIKGDPKYRNYKIKYLADESGFSSHSSFATTFKAIVGISPTAFIEFAGDETLKPKKT